MLVIIWTILYGHKKISPVLLSPGPSALTLPASWEGSTFTLNGLTGISWKSQVRRAQNKTICHLADGVTWPGPTFTEKMQSHLVSKQRHDGISTRTGGSVLDSEGVIVIFDDVKVDVCLSGADHSWGTLDSNADVS